MSGGPAAIEAIKSLRYSGFKGKIVTTDSNPLSAGLFQADKGYSTPRALDDGFLNYVLDIIEKEKIKLILPTSGFDIVLYSKNRDTG